MKNMSYLSNALWVAVFSALILVTGCSNGGDNPLTPSDTLTRSFNHEAAVLEYPNLDVEIMVPEDSVLEGEVVPLTVQVTPADLPIRGSSGTIHERIGWLSLTNIGAAGIVLQNELRVTFPLQEEYKAGTIYSVFFFNFSLGEWENTGRKATITDDGMHAVFNANQFGTWGVFKSVPLTVEIKASRTTAQAPASIGLSAIIDGGSPPYSVIWWFGDDSDPESGVAVSHLYEAPFTYTPAVVVVDAMNRQVSDTLNLNIH